MQQYHQLINAFREYCKHIERDRDTARKLAENLQKDTMINIKSNLSVNVDRPRKSMLSLLDDDDAPRLSKARSSTVQKQNTPVTSKIVNSGGPSSSTNLDAFRFPTPTVENGFRMATPTSTGDPAYRALTPSTPAFEILSKSNITSDQASRLSTPPKLERNRSISRDMESQNASTPSLLLSATFEKSDKNSAYEYYISNSGLLVSATIREIKGTNFPLLGQNDG